MSPLRLQRVGTSDGLKTFLDSWRRIEIHRPDAFMVEFVAASGRTQALVTLGPADVRAVADDDLVSVRPLVAKAP